MPRFTQWAILALFFALITLSQATTSRDFTIKRRDQACDHPQQRTDPDSDRSMANVSGAPQQLVAYNPQDYPNLDKFYKTWRQKCIDIVGPRNQHHRIAVDQADRTNQVWVYCGGQPKDDQGNYNTYNGPTVDTTSEEIRDLGLTCP